MPIPVKKVNKRRANWQKILPTQIPNLFYAYDETQERTEKVVSYKLSQEGVERLQQLDPEKQNYELSFILASKKPSRSRTVNNSPTFAPVLAIDLTPDSKDAQLEYYELEWERNPHFLDSSENHAVRSGIDAIPAAGAFLFIYNWLRQSAYQINQVFEYDLFSELKRVRAYTYIVDETKKIIADIQKEHDPSTEINVYIHLGVGLSVEDHPFSFRPVIEVHPKATKAKGKTRTKEDVFIELTSSSFFDFSRPCPPYCKD